MSETQGLTTDSLPATEVAERIRPSQWTQVSIHADGDDVPLAEGNGRWYVEIVCDGTPTQGWIAKSAVHKGTRGMLRANGVATVTKRVLRDWIRQGSLGRLGYRLTGIPERIVLHAHS